MSNHSGMFEVCPDQFRSENIVVFFFFFGGGGGGGGGGALLRSCQTHLLYYIISTLSSDHSLHTSTQSSSETTKMQR